MLKIWLPLNKDERNIGLAPGFCVNSGVTYDGIGPNGQICANFTGTNQYVRIPIDGLTGMTDYCSVCFWMKLSSFNTAWQTIFAFLKTGTPWTGNVFTFIRNNNTSAFTFSLSNGSSSTQVSLLTGNLSLDTWYHFACVYEPGLMSLYQNGELLRTYSTTIKPCFSAMTHAALGVECNTAFTSISYQHKGFISDFRVYDHRLRDWEIKKIYNSCFYEMESNLHLKGTTNLGGSSILYNGRNYGQEYSASSWGGDTGKVKFFKDGGYNNFPYKEYHKITSGTGGVYLAQTRDISIESGKTYTMSVYVKSNRNFRDSHYAFNINGVIPGDGNHYITNGQNISFTTEWQRLSRTFTTTTAETGNFSEMSIVYDDSVADYKVYYSGFQIEEGDQLSPFTYGNRAERFVDMSGLDNEVVPYNITQSGTSLYFNGTNSAIKVPITKIITGGTWSLNVWFYRPNGQFGSKAWETLIGGPSGFEFSSKRSSSSSPMLVAYSWGQSSSGGKAYEYDKWNMVTMVRTPSQFKAYLNGENFLTTTTVGGVPNGDYFVGAWKTYTQQNFKGYMKRFSIYTKVLSDDDVMNLYLHNE